MSHPLLAAKHFSQFQFSSLAHHQMHTLRNCLRIEHAQLLFMTSSGHNTHGSGDGQFRDQRPESASPNYNIITRAVVEHAIFIVGGWLLLKWSTINWSRVQ